MTSHPESLPLSEQVSCEVCLKEVPQSSAVDYEVGDYVAHFCGLECYAQWKGRGGKDAPAESSEK
ncbi:MAG: DUF3330 domain-containing protein [Gammaproteobacteria bacterium]|nr:DUF3330 domain-containing protein [Gammaproteobacteria bacterium]MDD2929644.1 DUF3330 domain-containing protein [Sideroxydans sp.]MDD5470980.1 DUF3330 domain-containing protein [Sideroxydans sp.]